MLPLRQDVRLAQADSLKLYAIDRNNEFATTFCITGFGTAAATGSLAGQVNVPLVLTITSTTFSRVTGPFECDFGSTVGPNAFPSTFDCEGTGLSNQGIEIDWIDCVSLCYNNGFGGGSCFGTKKRAAFNFFAASFASITLASSAGGDPHLVSAEGLKFIFNGIANAVYALFTSPVVDINMQLAATGPKERYMTEMGIVFRGKNVTITPWFGKRKGELTKFFESLNATVEFTGASMTVEFCNDHAATFTAMHATDGSKVNFLDVAISVPGCHDAYGGALGQTYRCEYVSGAKPFVWSHAQEESFRRPAAATRRRPTARTRTSSRASSRSAAARRRRPTAP